MSKPTTFQVKCIYCNSLCVVSELIFTLSHLLIAWTCTKCEAKGVQAIAYTDAFPRE